MTELGHKRGAGHGAKILANVCDAAGTAAQKPLRGLDFAR